MLIKNYMLIQFEEYLTFENIYMWTNFGILPFWIMLIIIPNSKVTQFFVNSIILPLILSVAYIYVIYQSILLEEPFLNISRRISRVPSGLTVNSFPDGVTQTHVGVPTSLPVHSRIPITLYSSVMKSLCFNR